MLNRSASFRAHLAMPHLPVLDGLRAMAIILVYLSHAGLGKLVPGGLGVTIFFFLSGYLITSLLRVEWSRDGQINLPAFSMRRAVRILPPLWITMMFVGTMSMAGWLPATPTVTGIVAQALFGTNYAQWAGVTGLPMLPLWSLAVEEHFYLVFPLLFVALMTRMTPRRVAGIFAAICALSMIVRLYHVIVLNDAYWTYYLSHTRLDSILYGAILALWKNPIFDHDHWAPKPVHVAAALSIILMTLVVRSPLFRETIRYTLQGGALFCLFSALLTTSGVWRTVSSHPILGRIGLYSYSIYLVHVVMIHQIATYVTGGSLVIAGGLAIAPTWVFAAAMHQWVERPLATARRRWMDRRHEALVLRANAHVMPLLEDPRDPAPVPVSMA